MIGAVVVASFGYRKEHDGTWVKKGAQPNDDEGHLPVEGDSSLLQSILDRFNGLQTYVGERFDSLEHQVDTRFEEMNSRIAKVEEVFTIIRDCFDLPSPPPSV